MNKYHFIWYTQPVTNMEYLDSQVTKKGSLTTVSIVGLGLANAKKSRVYEHARSSELSSENHSLFESVLSGAYMRCVRITESLSTALSFIVLYVCRWRA